MNPTVEFNLALILFLPWFAILGALFWIYPRVPRNGARRVFDAASLLLSLAAAAGGMAWGLLTADPTAGKMWKQVLATSVAYGLFLGVMTLAAWVRHRWLTGPRAARPATTSLQETTA
jgi:hypothetical protein